MSRLLEMNNCFYILSFIYKSVFKFGCSVVLELNKLYMVINLVVHLIVLVWWLVSIKIVNWCTVDVGEGSLSTEYIWFLLTVFRAQKESLKRLMPNRWFSRYVIAAMLVDENKRFLISSFCSSTSNCTLQHCYRCPKRLVANHLLPSWPL